MARAFADAICWNDLMAGDPEPESVPQGYRRTLQFTAGPHTQEFTACPAHVDQLRLGTSNGLFVPLTREPLCAVDDDDDTFTCDFCREG
jgi:hypothetical protein